MTLAHRRDAKTPGNDLRARARDQSTGIFKYRHLSPRDRPLGGTVPWLML